MKDKVERIVVHPSFETEYYAHNAHDSELIHWEYNIPEGFKAEIKDNKIIVDKIKI